MQKIVSSGAELPEAAEYAAVHALDLLELLFGHRADEHAEPTGAEPVWACEPEPQHIDEDGRLWDLHWSARVAECSWDGMSGLFLLEAARALPGGGYLAPVTAAFHVRTVPGTAPQVTVMLADED